ncbi:MAG: FAD-dependent monooxygenase [Pseudoxanthomonas sp.]
MRTDVAIVGAGPAGLCLARAGRDRAVGGPAGATAASRLREPAFDGREIALTHAPRRILQSLGIWRHIDASAIALLRQARIVDGHSPFALEIKPDPGQAGALGWLVSNHAIRRAAYAEARTHAGIVLRDGARVVLVSRSDRQVDVHLATGEPLRARLLVAADSRFSEVRRLLGVGAARFRQDHAGLSHAARIAARPNGAGMVSLRPHRGAVAAAWAAALGGAEAAPQQAQAWLAMDEASFGPAVTDVSKGGSGHAAGQSPPC